MYKLGGYQAVASVVAHQPGQHPPECPLKPDCVAVEFKTHGGGSRWQGCKRAYINARLRMVLVFDDLRDEVIRKRWTTVRKADRL
jgi:hypothetical protein